ncbi:uncharacterized protein KRP23_4488 [Phytophthora ramorum]|uniref:uncharacterized protein n=1 Tax=Phytophthora ramorum TaxID=164328 RepID=UPI0030A882A9|nr:hypothetical protein KRP23_4488 [Phytophthora ramorum]
MSQCSLCILDFLPQALHFRYLLPLHTFIPAHTFRVNLRLHALNVGSTQTFLFQDISSRCILGGFLSLSFILGLARFQVLRTAFGFKASSLSTYKSVREFLDIAACVQIALVSTSLSLHGIQAFSGEKFLLLVLHAGLAGVAVR